MEAYDGGATKDGSDLETATFLAVLNSTLHLRRLVPAASTIQALWKTLARDGKRRSPPRYRWVGVLERVARRRWTTPSRSPGCREAQHGTPQRP